MYSRNYKDTSKFGDRTIISDKELMEVFYSQKLSFIHKIKYIIKRPQYYADCEDIFLDSLIILREKFFINGKSDYTELRKILFGISRIQAYRWIANKNNDSNLSYIDNIEAQDSIYHIRSVYQEWYRKYQQKYYEIPKNRDKKRKYQTSETYKEKRIERDRRYREKKKSMI